MAIKDLLLLLKPGPQGEGATQFALSVAQTMGAHLTAVGVAVELAPPTSFIGDYPYRAMAEVARNAKAALEAAYSVLAAASAVPGELVIIQAAPGEARQRFARLARRYDLTIAAQSAHGAPEDPEDLAEAVLFGSGRAVFMVPRIHNGPAKLDRALFAWDGGLPAARALAESIPLLSCARTVEVVVISDAKEAAGSAAQIVQHLVRHGVSAAGRALPGCRDIGPALLSYAADFGADYLVMGAYGHSRMREFILGGATRAILKSMTVPTLMAH